MAAVVAAVAAEIVVAAEAAVADGAAVADVILLSDPFFLSVAVSPPQGVEGSLTGWAPL